jgi:hypothetical protein
MKKIIDSATWAFGAAITAGIAFHFDVGRELTVFLKFMAQKLVPWVNAVVYS